jgi:hypothetical protein
MVPESKQNRRYKQINFIDLQNNRHPSQHTVGNVHKASENCQQRPLYESIAELLSHFLGLPPHPFTELFGHTMYVYHTGVMSENPGVSSIPKTSSYSQKY